MTHEVDDDAFTEAFLAEADARPRWDEEVRLRAENERLRAVAEAINAELAYKFTVAQSRYMFPKTVHALDQLTSE